MAIRMKFAAAFIAASIGMGGVALAAPPLPSAETVQSQAEKRLEEQRKALVRNWQG